MFQARKLKLLLGNHAARRSVRQSASRTAVFFSITERPLRLGQNVYSRVMANATSSIIFDDIFKINDIDKEGKKFDRGLHFLLSFDEHP